METINIGIPIDLQKLLDTRLLVQAGSGGGESYLLRKLIESIGNSVQQIIIDPEGEFVTIREKFNFALVSQDGDIALSLRYAETLAHKILETGLSVIIDLYELKAHERILFVKRFIDALVNAPKELWHSCLVYVDEAHVFCPESSKSDSMSSVIDLCTRGRKRGFASILATQRLSKLHKDAAAECLNKMIGRTGLDIDRKRAGDELGMTGKADMLSLRDLAPGDFYAFGPAISNDVRKFRVSKVATTHLQSGRRLVTKPPTPDAVKRIVSKLANLPAEAEQELATKQQLQAEVTRLRAELSRATKGANPGIKAELEKVYAEHKQLKVAGRALSDEYKKLKAAAQKAAEILSAVSNVVVQTLPNIQVAMPEKAQLPASGRQPAVKPPAPARPVAGELGLGKCAGAILQFLASYSSRSFTKVQIAVGSNYSPTSSGFINAMSELNTRGLIVKEGNRVRISDSIEARAFMASNAQFEYSVETFRSKLSKCEGEIFDVLLMTPQAWYTKEELANATASKYSVSSSGFINSISGLNTLELIKKQGQNICLNPELLELM